LPPGSRLATTALEAATCDALLVLTEWPEFARIDPTLYAPSITRRVVIDGRNVLDSERVAAAGLTYRGVGRSAPASSDRQRIATVREVLSV
jgi:UDPglucose 6-dehydrogenase